MYFMAVYLNKESKIESSDEQINSLKTKPAQDRVRVDK